MIRLTLLYLLITFLCLYAFKDWYKSLCGLIALMAVMQHPDMPKSLFDIQGLNVWNVTVLFVLLGWVSSRRRENLLWDMPGKITAFLVLYIAVMLIGFFRLYFDSEGILQYAIAIGGEIPTEMQLISEYLINTLKWLVPAILLYDGCNSKSRALWALTAILLVYFVLALQVIQHMPLSQIADAEALEHRSQKVLSKDVGFHRVNLSMMLAGASWAIFSMRIVMASKSRSLLVWGLSLIVFIADALTGGRTGYATWGLIGLILSILKWRKLLLVGPLVLVLIIALIPQARDRMLQGFTAETHDTNVILEEEGLAGYDASGGISWYTVTSGRSVAWPFVIDEIINAPWIGYGREAMQNIGISEHLMVNFQESFPHPHNAYFQWALDNGIISLLVMAAFFVAILKISISLFRETRSNFIVAVGGVSLSLLLALLIASLGSQTFYPREGSVGMWCAIFLALRVYVQRKKMDKKYPDIKLESEVDSRLWLK
ncbi:MAG: hypothetical protein OI74_11895 [Gammaproteobacteria bacterium (ex Lamellibrachia satsuma)]|nr:MAG: O-antigen ligase family protein [Gammaproteobacteria bacterium (ex Lamellibrachia satsuma)]RRS32244.1 MAG: hypothetical protein OI74_11895 [Gammaproteobacteria bacterium (ex Lamellibrachia satsuma)]RRS33250.1 MAG: hypothetical protein NV67_16740 [Gammaproteobacteria bacterium (ex Lamellibrachia satsuma)]